MSASETERLSRLDSRDQEYIASLRGAERTTVVSTILSYWRQDSIGEGDPAPNVELFRAEDSRAVQLIDLLEGKPLVLVFGSYT